MDCAEVDQPPQTYRFAKNIIDGNVLGAKENEDGFAPAGIQAPYIIIGIVPVDIGFVVFSTDNSASEIGYTTRSGDVLNYTALYNDPALNFNTSSPIKGEYRVDVTGERVVAWVDGLNTPRILNIDDPASISDVQDLNVFRDISNPAILASSINDSGGSLKTGAYTIISRYQNKDGSETNWFVHDHVFYINDDSKGLAFNDDDGAPGGTLSNKSIGITFNGSDNRYDTLVVGYIQSSGSVVTASQVLRVTNASTVTVTIVGSESTTDLSLDEILTGNTSYTTARAITQLGGQLFLANLDADKIPELQQAALDIRIDYMHEPITVPSNSGNHKDNLPPSFMPGEVYAFYLAVEMNNGTLAFYHIPGRDPLAFDIVPVTNFGLSYTRFQASDTSDEVGGGATTNMGFWRNENETYPMDPSFQSPSRDLRGQRVQHHRFPDLSTLIVGHYNSDASIGITRLPRLGINVSNVLIPLDIQAKIKRWKVVYARKDNTNSLVTGGDLVQFGMGTASDSNVLWSTSGNWALEAEGPGWESFSLSTRDNLRIHSLDYLLDKATPSPTYARFHYKLRREQLNTQYGGFRSGGARMTISGEDRGQSSSAVIDYTVPGVTTRSNFSFAKRLDNFTYLPQNSQVGRFKSLYTEGCFVCDVNAPGTSFDNINAIRHLTNSSGTGADPEVFRESDGSITTTVGEETMYYQMYRLLTDLHTSVFEQDVIPLEQYATPGTSSLTNVFGGDTFLSYQSYLSISPLNANPDAKLGDPTRQGLRIWRGYIGYSRYNFNYRHQTTGDISSYYHGKTDPRTLFTKFVDTVDDEYGSLITANDAINMIQYNLDYNSLNNYMVGISSSVDLVQATSFPNTIIWSPIQNEESKEFSWQSFPAGNRYVIPKNKGPIVNLQGTDNKDLLIHTTRTLFKTRTDAKLSADQDNVFLKSADLFDIPPEEILSTTNGYAGTQDKFACVLTKVGYAFPDASQGKVFIYNDKLNEISSQGMRAFFRDSMQLSASGNPFTSTGFNMVYDERNNRLIISKKEEGVSWTASYNPQTQTWTAFHDYIPDYIFTTTDNTVYSIKDSVFYIHLIGPSAPKGSFYNGLYPSFIDIAYCPQNDRNKVFISTWWNTEVYPNEYINGQPNRLLDYNKTCTDVTVRTYDQSTGKVPVVRQSDYDDIYDSNVRVINRTWVYDNFRDVSTDTGVALGFYDDFNIDPTKLDTGMEWHDQRKFMDKFIICRYEFSPNTNQRWLFLESDITYRNEET